MNEYLRLQRLSTGDLGYHGMEAIPKKTSYLVPSLTLVEEVPDDSHPTEAISYLLKQRANSTSTASPTYKMYVRRFCEGTVQEWITTRKALEEIWTQNAITSATDQLATVRAILRGESLTIFNATIEENGTSVDDQGVSTNVVLTAEGVLAGIHAVAETVFPFRALSNQKLWMRRGMKKPRELSFRKTAAAVGRLNNSLPLFPKGKDTDKFNDEEIVELLEWSIPQTWRTKFDLDGYIPTEHSKARLITECEILERNEPHKSSSGAPTSKLRTKDKSHNKGTSKYKNDSKSTTDKKAGFYCTEHGANPTHNTDSCYTIKNRSSKKGNDSATMTKKSFRREINLLSHKKPKKKVLEMFAAVLSEERAKTSKKKKAANKAKKRKQREVATSSTSESSSEEDEIHMIDTFGPRLKAQRHSKNVAASELSDSNQSTLESNESTEEHAYKTSIQDLGKTRDGDGSAETPIMTN